MDLAELMKEYKIATENFIKALGEQQDGQPFLERREKIIENLKALDFSKEEFKSIVQEINLMSLEGKAHKALENEKEKIQRELIDLKKIKSASQSYGNQLNGISFLNQQI